MVGTMTTRAVGEWKSVLRVALRAAQVARQPEAVAAFRETLAALDNAEAAEPGAAPPIEPGVIAGGVAGLGAGEVPRRALSPAEATDIVAREIEERRRAAATYAGLGRAAEAATLQRQADALVALR
jgi:hypothetical protein